MSEPVLKQREYTENGRRYRLTVNGGLHFIRGNKTPYFTLTGSVDEMRGGAWRDYMCGSIHEIILKYYKGLEPLAKLHLSDIDGQPSYAAENGWFWLAGAMGGAGEKYHGGSGSGAKTADEFLQIFADHVRIDLDAAVAMRDSKPTKASFAAWCETQRPRWKLEADDCIKSLGLVVFGDHWEPEQEGRRHA